MRNIPITIAITLFYMSSFPVHLFADEEVNGIKNEELTDIQLIDNTISNDDQNAPEEPNILLENENIKDKEYENNKVTNDNQDSLLNTKSSDSRSEYENEYNSLGIKIGTKVYGEDISKLNEKELQYIPEGWRDGTFESEHRENEETKSKSLMRSMQAFPNVNNYIISSKLNVPKIEYDHKIFFTKFNFRKGFGMAEGVVAHETANDSSTIMGEINYMSNNHKNAFVHAFVDGSRIIEIHPTDLAAWGAGRFANERFVHVELVRESTFDRFARSINNYASYIASILYKYNLEVISAEQTGSGTLWSHKAVSNFLGGTNHVDPHGYFQKWGYSWNEFVKLVSVKYQELDSIQPQSISSLGHIRSSSTRIFQSPTNQNNYFTAGSEYSNEVYYIKQKTEFKGTTFYLLSREPSSTKGVIGWIKADGVSLNTHVGVDKSAKIFILQGTGSAFNKAWGGAKNLVYSSLSEYKNDVFQVNLTEKVGNNIWYRGKINGKTVWIHSNFLTNSIETPTSTSLLGHLNKPQVQMFSGLEDMNITNSKELTNTDEVFYIKRQRLLDGQLFYLISTEPSATKGVLGWVNSVDVATHIHKGVDKNPKTYYIKGNGIAYNKAWGGKNNILYENMTLYKNLPFQVNLTEAVGNNTWYRGILNGKTIWLHSSYVTSEGSSSTSRLAHIRNSKVIIYSNPGKKSIGTAGSSNINQVYYIKKQSIVQGENYYLLSKEPSSVKGVLGWVKAKDLSSYTHTGVDKNKKTFYLKGTGSSYSKAWGGSKDIVYKNLSQFKGKKFVVNLTEKVGNNIWYRGTLNGKTIWVHESYVDK